MYRQYIHRIRIKVCLNCRRVIACFNKQFQIIYKTNHPVFFCHQLKIAYMLEKFSQILDF